MITHLPAAAEIKWEGGGGGLGAGHRRRKLTRKDIDDIVAPTTTTTSAVASSTTAPPVDSSSHNSKRRDPLRFRFKGYSLWLEPEQFSLRIPSKKSDTLFSHTKSNTKSNTRVVSDLDYILALAGAEKGVSPIPQPHLTLLYGMCQFASEEEIKTVFNGPLREALEEIITRENNGISDRSSPLQFNSGLAGVVFDGIDGEEMDMAWTEISLDTNPVYDRILKTVHHIFYKEQPQQQQQPAWKPHISLAYDNPEETILHDETVRDLIARFPTLTKERNVKAISLWDTNGTMSEWKCLDRICLQPQK